MGLDHLTQRDRGQGLLEALFNYVEKSLFVSFGWLRGNVRRYRGGSPTEVLAKILEERRIDGAHVRHSLLRKALILKWLGGLDHKSELHVACFFHAATVAELLTVRFIPESLAEDPLDAHPHLKTKQEHEKPVDQKGATSSTAHHMCCYSYLIGAYLDS